MFPIKNVFKIAQKTSTLFLLIFLAFSVAQAAPGDLDPTFDLDGKTTTAIGVGQDVGRDVAVQADGKIVVAGYSDGSFPFTDFSLARYNTEAR